MAVFLKDYRVKIFKTFVNVSGGFADLHGVSKLMFGCFIIINRIGTWIQVMIVLPLYPPSVVYTAVCIPHIHSRTRSNMAPVGLLRSPHWYISEGYIYQIYQIDISDIYISDWYISEYWYINVMVEYILPWRLRVLEQGLLWARRRHLAGLFDDNRRESFDQRHAQTVAWSLARFILHQTLLFPWS